MATLIHGDRIGKTALIRVGCAAVIFDDNRQKVLLTRRTDNGRWCLPGGALDAGEDISECCLREVREETGLVGRIEKLVGVYSSPDWVTTYADGNRWQVVAFLFEVVPTGGKVGLSDETTEVGYFTQADIETMDVMETHQLRLADAFANLPYIVVK